MRALRSAVRVAWLFVVIAALGARFIVRRVLVVGREAVAVIVIIGGHKLVFRDCSRCGQQREARSLDWRASAVMIVSVLNGFAFFIIETSK